MQSPRMSPTGPRAPRPSRDLSVVNIGSPDAGTADLPTSPLLSAGPQYATYRDSVVPPEQDGLSGEGLLAYTPNRGGQTPASEEKEKPWVPDAVTGDSESTYGPAVVINPWVPLPLRPWFWIPLVVLMAGGGIAFEVALFFSKKNQGWATKGMFTTETGFMHYVYTFPPVAISMLFAGLWAWTDIEIRRLQPYVDLAQGNSPPQRSLLLDYTRSHTFVVWSVAARNRHWLVTLGSLLVVITFFFQPLAAALLTVEDIFWQEPRSVTNNLAAISLNQDANFEDLTSFLTAAGYASADVLYGIGDPKFVHQGYTIAPINLPSISNGTVFANTTAVLSKPTCVQPDAGSLSMVKLNDGGQWNNTASFQGCTFSWSVNKTAVNLFGVDPIDDSVECAVFTSQAEQFRPVIFWFFTYQPIAMASLTMCAPGITLSDVSVQIDLASGNLTAVDVLGPLGSGNGTPKAFSQFAGNVTGDPLNGRAYNGMFFELTDPDEFTLARLAAIQLSLPAAVFQSAETSGLTAAFQENKFAELSEHVYAMYLSLVAKTVYFVEFEQPIDIDLKTIHKRLLLSPVATHLLASAMFVLAVFGTILQLWHRRERSILRLAHAPGTIASAVSLGGQTGLGSVLAPRLREDEMKAALENKRFRIDTRTLKIVMEGEEGYQDAASPARLNFRQSMLGLGRRFSMGNRMNRRNGEEGMSRTAV